MTIRGYTDRPNAGPGESISVHVSSDEPGDYRARLLRLSHLDPAPDGPGIKVRPVPGMSERRCRGHRRRTQVGSYVEVPPESALVPKHGMAVHLFVQATRPEAGPQAVISCWSEETRNGWGLFLENGCLEFTVGASGATASVQSDRPLFRGIWYSVAAVHDAGDGAVRLIQAPIVGRAQSVFGLVVPLDSSFEGEQSARGLVPQSPGTPLIIAGMAESADPERTWVRACFDGKIDSPCLYDRPLSPNEVGSLAAGREVLDGLVARWDFAAGVSANGIPSDRVIDVCARAHDGLSVNQPDRGMTGWNWSGRHDVFTSAPDEYGALGFHSDALDDCRWPADFEVEIPGDLPSGCYAFHVTQGQTEDHIPFFVRPAVSAERAPIVVVIPTLTYVAYANFHNLYPGDGWGFDPYELANGVVPLERRDLEMLARPEDYGRSTYDLHADGRGVQHASWRRPMLDARPGQGFSFNFQADFYLIDWLEERGFSFDVVTDHDLHEWGAELLCPYRVLITGSHPEYCTWDMLDAYEDYVRRGGRTMYLGANGAYWVTAIHPEKPWLAEVRRGDTGDAAWHARPGEYHHSFTGERGGLWRHRGRPPQKLWGTGYSAHSFGVSGYYVRLPDSFDERVAWMFDGIAADELIGDSGLVGGGAAGLELDSYDRALGTPPHALLLASSVEHDEAAMLVPEELSNIHPAIVGDEHPKIRADIVYFTTHNGGGMFSTSSIAWSGSLSAHGYQNAVSKLTENVLKRFLSDEPLPSVNAPLE